MGFNRLESQQHGHTIPSCRIVFKCVYVGFNGDRRVYVGFLNERHLHIEKHEKLRSYNRS